jgi:L-asparaginase II
MPSSARYPDNPVLVTVWRGGVVESVHRGAWCLVDTAGEVLDGAGDVEAPYYVRSSIKSVQALALLESGAAERFDFSDEELALALASHSGEPRHTRIVARTLERLGLGVRHLLCGAHPPTDGTERAALRARGEAPCALHNNCSGKHAGFLALARHLDVPLESYLDPAGEGQRRVRATLAELADVPVESLVPGVDGCSAPTYRLPLRRLALAFARVTSPAGLAPERAAFLDRETRVAGRFPELIGGSRRRLDTELMRATQGRLFAKIGAEGVEGIGRVGGGQALALKIDDGGLRALHALVVALLERLGWIEEAALEALRPFRETPLVNHAGREVGRVEVRME